MVGNDIVDLNEAYKASNWERPRFLEKLFSDAEQFFIKNSDDPFIMVWRLWSMKESSYKLYTQLNPSRFYNPKAFQCSIKGNKGIVTFKDFMYYLETKTTSNYIISEARLAEHKLESSIFRFKMAEPKWQSAILKSKLLERFSGDFQLNKDAFNIPVLINGKDLYNVSLTHHGKFGAYVIA